MDTGSESDRSFKQGLALTAHMMASEKRHIMFYAELYAKEVDSSIPEFSYIWSPGGFDLEIVQAAEEDVQVNKGGVTRPQQQQFSETNVAVSYPRTPSW